MRAFFLAALLATPTLLPSLTSLPSQCTKEIAP